MRTRIVLSALCLGAIASGVPEVNAQPITRSGPNSAHATRLMNVPSTDQQLVTASITAGTSNRILMIFASVNDDQAGGSASSYWIYPMVNGQYLGAYQSPTPILGILSMPPPSTFHANATTMTWWLDLDSAGLANVPLNIVLRGSATPISSVAHISFSAFTVAK